MSEIQVLPGGGQMKVPSKTDQTYISKEAVAYAYYLTDHAVAEWAEGAIGSAPVHSLRNRVDDCVKAIALRCGITLQHSDAEYLRFFAHTACSIKSDLREKIPKSLPYAQYEIKKAHKVAYEIVCLSFAYKRKVMEERGEDFLRVNPPRMIAQLTSQAGIPPDSAIAFVKNILKDVFLNKEHSPA